MKHNCVHTEDAADCESITASDEFKLAYLRCALWASTDDDEEPLDKRFDVLDIDSESIRTMHDDCDAFARHCHCIGEAWHYLSPQYSDDELAGQDFWLTRNHHGAGFWDRGLVNGDALTNAAHSFGESNLYVGDNGKLFID